MQRAAEPECKQRQNACHLEKFATRLKTETLVEGILLNDGDIFYQELNIDEKPILLRSFTEFQLLSPPMPR